MRNPQPLAEQRARVAFRERRLTDAYRELGLCSRLQLGSALGRPIPLASA